MGTVSTNSTYTFTVTGNRSLTAVFEAVIPTYTITAAIDPPEAGTVTGAGQYQQGAAVTLTAAINDGYSFTGWQENGETVSTDNPYTFTAEGNRAFTAAFVEKPASRLPDGYTEVEYISNPNLGYIQDAGIPKSIAGHTINLRADFTETSANGNVMGNIYDWLTRRLSSGKYTYGYNQYVYYLFKNKSGKKLALYINQTSNSGLSSLPTRPVPRTYSLDSDNETVQSVWIDVPERLFKVNDAEITTYGYTTSSTGLLPFALFAANRSYANAGQAPTNTYGYSPCNYKFYSMQVTEKETGAVVNDFVPCVNEEGLAGLYDLVKETFYSSSVAEKPFTAGPPV